MWADPGDVGYMLAGSNMGGLWKSTDTGHTWRNITDPKPAGNNQVLPGTVGANCLAVNPLNNDLIYIATNVDQTYHKHWGYALGMVYSKTTYPFVG